MVEFEDLSLTVKADKVVIPDNLTEVNLYLFLKAELVRCLSNEVSIIHFGLAPDNTADNEDELLYDGIQLRLICNEKYLGIDLDSPDFEVVSAFKKLVENHVPKWTTIMEERGLIKLETTIELVYSEVFTLEQP